MELYDDEVGKESQELDKLSTIKAQVNNLIGNMRSL